MIFVIILSIVLSSCGSTIKPKTGHWEGQTEDGQWKIVFDYDAKGQIDNVGVIANSIQGFACLFQIPNIVLSANSFKQEINITDLSQGVGVVGKISGKFSDESAISGTLLIESCGRTFSVDKKEIPWTGTQTSDLQLFSPSTIAVFTANGFKENTPEEVNSCSVICKVYSNLNQRINIYINKVDSYSFRIDSYNPTLSEDVDQFVQLQKVIGEAISGDLASAIMNELKNNTTESAIKDGSHFGRFEGTSEKYNWTLKVDGILRSTSPGSTDVAPGSVAVKILINIIPK
jgi:hypothetical protein